ncbi:MAG: hypothetical protein ACXAC5_01425 [Promethearchaeota archaeon]|jgi:hypothetical protein
MATVNIQENPAIGPQGTRDGDAVVITSEIVTDNLVYYEIENITTAEIITINDAMSTQEGGNIVDVTKAQLKIILPFRTDFRVRTRAQDGSFGAYVNFKTRDKRYQSPEAVTQLTDDTDSSAQTQGTKVDSGGHLVAQGGSRTIVVTNNAKAAETDDSPAGYNQARNWGPATVHNTDTIYNDGQLQTSTEGIAVPVLFTDRGATVVNVPVGQDAPIVFTDRGATVTTNS